MPARLLQQLSLLKVLALVDTDSMDCPKLAGLTALEALSLAGFREDERFMLKMPLGLTNLRSAQFTLPNLVPACHGPVAGVHS